MGENRVRSRDRHLAWWGATTMPKWQCKWQTGLCSCWQTPLLEGIFVVRHSEIKSRIRKQWQTMNVARVTAGYQIIFELSFRLHTHTHTHIPHLQGAHVFQLSLKSGYLELHTDEHLHGIVRETDSEMSEGRAWNGCVDIGLCQGTRISSGAGGLIKLQVDKQLKLCQHAGQCK